MPRPRDLRGQQIHLRAVTSAPPWRRGKPRSVRRQHLCDREEGHRARRARSATCRGRGQTSRVPPGAPGFPRLVQGAPRHLLSGLRRANVQPVQPGKAQPLCRMLIPSPLFPPQDGAAPPRPAPEPPVSLLPGDPRGPRAWQPSLQSKRTTRWKPTRFSSQGTSGFQPDNMLFQFYFSLNPTKFHVYL